MSVVNELVEAIEADPRDEGPQLVIADYLQSVEDPRGDLIVLDHRERANDLHDPVALDQLLFLAAQYSFPRAEPDDPLLPFQYQNHGEYSSYRLVHADRLYELYPIGTEAWPERPYIRSGFVSDVDAGDDDGEGWQYSMLDIRFDDAPYYDATSVLQIVSDALHANTPLESLKFPFGPLAFPQYEGSPLRCYMLPIEFLRRHDLLRNQLGLAARDYYRWHRIWERLRGMTPR